MIGHASSWRRGGIRPWGSRELSPYGGGRIPIGTTLSLWRNPPIGEQRAVTMWRRKDTHRDNPVTMEERKSLMGEQETATIMEVTCRGAVCCHYKGQERRRI
jgi:hypothetical protein